MQHDTILINIMISSPSDAKDEQKDFHNVLQRYNHVNAGTHKIVLMPLSGKSSGLINNYDISQPQDVIDLGVVDKADILVVVLKGKMGTPTINFRSGTEQEIKRHIKNKKPFFLYYSDVEEEDSVLINFKKELSLRSYYYKYDKGTFSIKFMDDLQKYINENIIVDINRNKLERLEKNIHTFKTELAYILTQKKLEQSCYFELRDFVFVIKNEKNEDKIKLLNRYADIDRIVNVLLDYNIFDKYIPDDCVMFPASQCYRLSAKGWDEIQFIIREGQHIK